MPTIKYPKNPNIDTAFVEQDDGTRNRALMVAPQDISTLELPNNPNSTKGYVTIDGKKQRVILTADISGAGGGDQHNLGWYATQAALEEAHPTATAGDWAIVGATDTVWIWDTDNSAWVDSDQKGQVTSVNGQTGDVTLTIPAAQVNSDWNANSGVAQILNKPTIPDAIQVSAMPTASATEEDKIYQFTGTTDANYTNGYFYKCVSDGQTPATYSWTQVDVQPTPSGLPDQTGKSGKFLTTDGTDASWGTISALQNTATNTSSLIVSKITSGTILSTGNNTIFSSISGVNIKAEGNVTGFGAEIGLGLNGNAVFGTSAYFQDYVRNSVAIGYQSGTKGGAWNLQHKYIITVGSGANVGDRDTTTAIIGAMQFGKGANLESGTVCFGLTTDGINFNNYKLLDSDGTIPAARHASLPAADGTYVLKLVISGGVPTLSWVAE